MNHNLTNPSSDMILYLTIKNQEESYEK